MEAAKMLFGGVASAKALASVADIEQMNEWCEGQARREPTRFWVFPHVYEIGI